MCGIGGMARIDGAWLDPAADLILDRLADFVAHRGPDDRRLMRDGPVGFAFTRLSLVGPNDGAQPLVSDDGNLMLMVNGEIYNHKDLEARLGYRPRTSSDCEVLLPLYAKHGLDFLDHVHGMFALVLWDKLNNQLIFAKDRFGIKPLFFHRNSQRIIFGSEIKSLFADPATPRNIDWSAALANPTLGIATNFSHKPLATWFQDVHTIPAATVMRINLADGGAMSHQYWSFPAAAAAGHPLDDEKLVERYRDLLAASVADCATADTELGLFLSGGVDSSLVAALAAPHSDPLHTFSVVNAGTHSNGDAEKAKQVADHLGLPNHQVIFEASRVPEPEEWKRLLWLSETPLCNPEVFYKYELHRYAKAVRPQLRGMLLGAAADEFAGGYTDIYAMGGGYAEFRDNIRNMAVSAAVERIPGLARWVAGGLIQDDAIADLTGVDISDPYHSYLKWEYAKVQQYNCWHEDRTAAGSGIEARVPFLDHRLIELLGSLPVERREAMLWDKRLIRAAAKGLLPDDIVHRPKVAFFHGAREQVVYRTFVRMLAKHDSCLVEEALAATDAQRYLEPSGVRRALAEAIADPTAERVEMLLRAVNLGLLAAQLDQLLEPIVARAAGPLPTTVETISDQVIEALAEPTSIDPDAVVKLRPEVLLLHSSGDSWYLAVNGSLEFEPESEWLAVLQAAAEATRTAADIAANTAGGEQILAELLELRIVEVR